MQKKRLFANNHISVQTHMTEMKKTYHNKGIQVVQYKGPHSKSSEVGGLGQAVYRM